MIVNKFGCGLSVGKLVQFLLYGKNASSVSREYVRHAWMSTSDDFVRAAGRRPAAAPRHKPKSSETICLKTEGDFNRPSQQSPFCKSYVAPIGVRSIVCMSVCVYVSLRMDISRIT